MAKADAEPREEDAEKEGTRQVRVYEDMGEMIGWIVKVEGITTAALLDPMIRSQITARHKKHEKAVATLKAAHEELKRVQAQVRQVARTGKPKHED